MNKMTENKSMNIREVPIETRKRLKILKEEQEHKNQAQTLKFLLDEYENANRKG